MKGPIDWIKTRGSLRGLARWCFLATLLLAPWLYGGTTAWSIELIDGMVGLSLALWAASLLHDRRWPEIPRGLAVIVGLILLQGWWMVANAHAIYDSNFRVFFPIRPVSEKLTGSADFVLSFAWMLRATGLLGAVCLVAELAQRRRWVLRLWSTIAISGGSIALLGLVQKGTGAHMIFWGAGPPADFYTFFAAYYYHANAGSFLNLMLAPVAGLLFWSTVRQASPWARALWISMLLFVAVAVLSNTSRMAQAIAGALIITIIAGIVRTAPKMEMRLEKQNVLVAVFVGVLAMLAIAQAARLDRGWKRWQMLGQQLPQDARWRAVRAAIPGIADAGTFGYGSGTFRAIFPPYQQSTANLEGTWRFLHNDYLQTILEWGWLGTVLIGALFFGGIGIAARNYLKAEGWSTRQRILLPSVLLSLIGVAVHAAVDFPLQVLSLQLIVATYLGICWGSSGWERRMEPAGAERHRAREGKRARASESEANG